MEKSLFENMKAIFRHYRTRFAKAFAMVLISNGLLILNPLVLRQAVNELASPATVQSGILSRWLHQLLGPYNKSLAIWALLLLIITAISAYFKYRMRYEFISVSRDAEKDLRFKIFERIQKQSKAFYDNHGIGELLSRLTNDISTYRDVLGPGIMYPLFFLTIVIPGVFALYVISPYLAFLSVIPLMVIPLLNMAIRNKVYSISHAVQKGLADISNMTQEHYSGIRILKGYADEKSFFKRFIDLSRQLIGLNLRLSCYQGLLFPFFTLITKMTTVAIVLLFGYIVLRAFGTLDAADFVSFMWIQSYIYVPVLMLAYVLPIYQRGRAAYDRLLEIYNEPIEVKDGKNKDLKIPELADLFFNNLTFRYPKASQPVLKNLTLNIPGGTFVGITGPVGSGKSTLLRLLNREYEIPPGMIYIGGTDIHEYPREAFQQQMVTVEQIPFLFSKSIADNVRFGREDATVEDVELVSKHADLHETVLSFPDQYDTVIGERGVTLSGGQRQRVAMARAFLVNRSILLLDDIFSAVDAATEKSIFAAMKTNFQKKTVLLITHRASLLESMDRVIYMSEGHIVEDGPPSQLVTLGGHYAALVELQKWNKGRS